MQNHKNQFNLIIIAVLASFAFIIGGLPKALGICLISSESSLLIFLIIWFGFLLQSATGMAVLAYLLRSHYPARKLWLAGTSAFAMGILFPALLLNQFIYAILFFPGLLVGMFFRQFLNEQHGRESLLIMITLGFFICQILISTFQNNIPGTVWLSEHFGPLSVTIIVHMIMDAIIGFFVALGVGLTILRVNHESNI